MLIESDLIRWTVNMLSGRKEHISEYSYEYGTALLMNLSLRTMGKQKCEEMKSGVLGLLKNLIEHENMQVRTFVNGTLYSLFSRRTMKNYGKKMNFDNILKTLIQNSPEKFKKHYTYVLNQLNAESEEDGNLSEINEDENDVDLLEDEEIGEEDEEGDPIDENFGLRGEDLLQNSPLEGKEAENVQFHFLLLILTLLAAEHSGSYNGGNNEYVKT